jgi:hypothetical protein
LDNKHLPAKFREAAGDNTFLVSTLQAGQGNNLSIRHGITYQVFNQLGY